MKILENNIFWAVVLGVVLIGISVLLLNQAVQSTMDRFEWGEESYIVEEGDSLWTISHDYCPEKVDRRDWIDEVQALNDLPSSKIYPGQVLTVLAPIK